MARKSPKSVPPPKPAVDTWTLEHYGARAAYVMELVADAIGEAMTKRFQGLREEIEDLDAKTSVWISILNEESEQMNDQLSDWREQRGA